MLCGSLLMIRWTSVSLYIGHLESWQASVIWSVRILVSTCLSSYFPQKYATRPARFFPQETGVSLRPHGHMRLSVSIRYTNVKPVAQYAQTLRMHESQLPALPRCKIYCKFRSSLFKIMKV